MTRKKKLNIIGLKELYPFIFLSLRTKMYKFRIGMNSNFTVEVKD